MADIIVLLMGVGLPPEPSGITRAMQILMNYFRCKGVVLTNDVAALKIHPIGEGRVYVSRSALLPSLLPWPFSSLEIIRQPRRVIGEYVRLLTDCYRIIDREKVNRICLNTVYQLYALSFLLPVIKFLKRHIKITVLVYDLDELAWCRGKAAVRLLLNSGLVEDVVTVHTSMKCLLRQMVTRVPVFTIGFGVSADLLRLARATPDQIRSRISPCLPAVLSQDKQSVVVLFYGRIVPRRRLEDLVLAFSKLQSVSGIPTSVLYLAGYTDTDKAYLMKLRALVRQLACDDVIRFLATLTTEELAYLYHKSDIFVFPAVQQPWGLAPLEAMAFGKPTIITDECGLSKVLVSKNVALIARARDPDDLCRCLESLVRDEAARHLLGEAGRVFVEQNMTFNHTGMELEKVWCDYDRK